MWEEPNQDLSCPELRLTDSALKDVGERMVIQPTLKADSVAL